MKKKRTIGRRILTGAAALIIAAGIFGTPLESRAEYYIGYDNINIRDDAYGNVLGNIPKDTVVEITETKTGGDGNVWSHVTYTEDGEEKEGWVRSDLILGEDDEEEETAETEAEETEAEEESAEEDTEETGEDTSSDTYEISGDGYASNGDGTFTVLGVTMSISDSYDEDDIPENFTAVTITYNGEEITAFKFDEGEVFLIWLEDESGDGSFFVFDTERDCVVSYIRLTAGSSFLILLLAPESEVISESYEKTLVAVSETDGITAYGYAQDETTLSSGISTDDYCFLYGISQDGVTGWYLFDNVNQTYIRATTDLSVGLDAEDAAADTQSDTLSLEKMLIVCLAALCLLFLVLTILFGIRSRRARLSLPDDMYDEDEEEEIKTRTGQRREERKLSRERESSSEKEDPEKENPEEKNPEEETSGESRDPASPASGTGSFDEMEQLLVNTLYGNGEEEKKIPAAEDSPVQEAGGNARASASESEPQEGAGTDPDDDGEPLDDWGDDLEFLEL